MQPLHLPPEAATSRSQDFVGLIYDSWILRDIFAGNNTEASITLTHRPYTLAVVDRLSHSTNRDP